MRARDQRVMALLVVTAVAVMASVAGADDGTRPAAPTLRLDDPPAARRTGATPAAPAPANVPAPAVAPDPVAAPAPAAAPPPTTPAPAPPAPAPRLAAPAPPRGAAAPAASPEASADDGDFEPVSAAGEAVATEGLSSPVMVASAYGAIWLVVVVYLLLLGRRNRRLAEELDRLQQRLDAHLRGEARR